MPVMITRDYDICY